LRTAMVGRCTSSTTASLFRNFSESRETQAQG
jgi:hypothetical protein